MSARTLLAAGTTATAASAATWAEWQQQVQRPGAVWVAALYATGSITALAAAAALGSWARIVYAAAVPKPEAPGSRPALGSDGRPLPAWLLRPPSRHGADRTPPGDHADVDYFKPGRRYTAHEMRRWSL